MHLSEIRDNLDTVHQRPGANPASDHGRRWYHARTLIRRDLPAGGGESSQDNEALPGLDLLRGFAAISVVVYHVIELFNWYDFPVDNWVALWFRIGGLGVDLFFVISGLVITLSLLKLHERDPACYAWTYARRRLARIVPLHYLTCLVCIMLITPAIRYIPGFTNQILTHILFIHNFFPSTLGAINGVNWTLGVEMQFYGFLLLALPLLHRSRPISVVLVLSGVSWLWRAMAFFYTRGMVSSGLNFTWFATTQLPGTLDEFGFGIALAIILHRDKNGSIRWFLRTSRWVWPLAAMVILKVTMNIYWKDSAFWGNPRMVIFWRTMLAASWAVVVVAACALEDRWFRTITTPLTYMGKISYGIYLWHLPVIMLLLPKLAGRPRTACALTLFFTIVLASISWHFFEKPILRRLGSPKPVL